MTNNNFKKGNPLALLPLGVFLLLFIGTGIITKDFYKMPVIVAFTISAAVALLMNRQENIEKKVEIFCKGAGETNVILMIIILILAGAFGQVAKEIGGVESTVNLGLSFLPQNLLIVGVFFIACLISLSMGTSMGTIVALAPIAVGISENTGIPVALALGAVVGGGMFGDNLSMISDSTIAAVRTQGCKMADKFKMNFFIVLLPAVITIVLLWILTPSGQTQISGSHPYEIVKVLPYIGVLIAALSGMNVMLVLAGGIIFSGSIGIICGDFGIYELFQAMATGMRNLQDLSVTIIIIGGTVELIKYNGGIDYLLNLITSKMKTKKGAELGIAALVSLVNLSTANNTISILMAGPLAKDISQKYDIDPRRTASLLDIFACSCQGIIPYGAQLLVAAGVASITPIEIMKYLYYPVLTGIFGIISIYLGFPKLKKSKNSEAENIA
ncbi:Na+/H+ antiporter NhaC family protein [Tepidibacter mesophilus]|uniref:Na+/H+ antiporter NhaC family protein n=1 Tax=Tepidibacter mesophilus TaxID=655607 RepID=UPI000C084DE4|nr:Na+/H+ antiporter NhaC family protein [Tepidibacter mesophilus]